MTKPLVILDPGHGGIDPETGKYVTSGKRFGFPDGLKVYEGVVNRAVVKEVERRLWERGWPCMNLVQTWRDVGLRERTDLANHLHRVYPKAVLVSVHHNAGGGEGMECFSYPSSEPSKRLNEAIYRGFERVLPNYPRRGFAKTKNLHMLRETTMPAVLVECGFMDWRNDAEFMLSGEGQAAFGQAIVEGLGIFNS